MDYSELISRAWRITWNNKFLWVLGFLAALGSTGGGGSGGRTTWTNDQFNFPELARIGALLAGLVCLALIIGLALWLLSLVAKGGLISAAARLDDGEKMTLGDAFGAGTRYLGRLIGVTLLLYGPLIILVIVAAAVVAAAIGGWVTIADFNNLSDPSEFPAGIGLLIFCVLGLLCLLFPVGLLITFIYPFAIRGAVLQDLGVTASISHGWRVLRENLAEIILLAILFLVFNVIFGFAVGILFVPLGLVIFAPLAAMGFDGRSFGPLEILLLVGAGLCLGILGAALQSILTTWQSTTFTLAYKEFVGKRAEVVTPEL